jgi:ferredoxin
VDICPEVFALEEGAEAATVIQPTGGPEEQIQKAIDGCPTSCIGLTGVEGVPEEGEGQPAETQEPEPAAREQQKKKETPQKPSQGEEEAGGTTGKKVVIEASECTACGVCVEACPEVFALEEGAQAATVIQPTGGPEDKIQKAIDGCPTSCIHEQ